MSININLHNKAGEMISLLSEKYSQIQMKEIFETAAASINVQMTNEIIMKTMAASLNNILNQGK